MRLDAIVVGALVLVHLAVAGLHDGAHTDLAIALSALQDAFIYLVIVGAPLLGAILLWTSYRTAGLGLVVLGMIGALIFGVVHHYMLESVDHISHLPAGTPEEHGTFIWTAGAIAILEGVCAGVAGYFLGTRASRKREAHGS